MAFIQTDDKLLNDQQPGQLQPGQNQALPGSSAAPLVGADSSVVGSGSTAGGSGVQGTTGAGGQGGWTNIQNYISANKDNATGANLLQDKVNSQFQSDRSDLQSKADSTVNQSKDQVKGINDAYTNADAWLNQGAKDYSWDGHQNDAYTEKANKLRDSITKQYSGPKDFNYSLSDKTNNYGTDLGNDKGFTSMLGNFYQDAAGGQLSSGQRNLQHQLDVTNEPLNQTRQKLLKDYSGLGDYAKARLTDANHDIQANQGQFQKNQSSLKDFLNNKSTDLNTTIGKNESNAKSSYLDEYQNGKSGREGYGQWVNEHLHDSGPYTALDGFDDAMGTLQNNGLVSPNMTYAQLQKEDDVGDILSGKWGGAYGEPRSVDPSILPTNKQALNDFYSKEDQKYGGTADPEKRQWNMIQDIFGNADKKQQGFKVRG